MPSTLVPTTCAAPSRVPGTLLGRGCELPCDTRLTGLNNNVLVIGPSGAGKTRHVLKPNLLQMNASYVVLDTKGTLAREMGPVLAANGYTVQRIDFTCLCGPALPPIAGVEDVGYDPLAHVRRYGDHRVPDQQDIVSVARAICPVENGDDPFWDNAAANLVTALIAYTLEELPRSEQTFSSVVELAEHLGCGATFRLLEELETIDPRSFAYALYQRYGATRSADKMNASIMGIVAEKLMCLGFDGVRRLYDNPNQLDFSRMGNERMAVFVTTSDIDRSLDPLVSLFVSHAFAGLMREADRSPDGALRVPVRLLLDDFANLSIPNIDDVLAVARSREIWCTLLLQSYTQLEARYGRARSMSILGNCDTQLVLGFQDVDSARCYADRANKTVNTLLETPRGRWWLFMRGRRAEQVEAYRLEEHPRYRACSEALGQEATHEDGLARSAA